MKQTITPTVEKRHNYFRGIFFLMISLWFSMESKAVTISIPAVPGTDTSSFTPTNRRFAFSASRMLFSPSEIGSTGTITAIAFQKASGSISTPVNYITIYMKETTSSTITTAVPANINNYALSGYKKVYFSNAIDNSITSGWTTVVLSTAVTDSTLMTYSGGSNYLDVIIVKESSETAVTVAGNYPIYNTHNTSGSISAYYHSASTSLYGATNFTTLTTKRPNIQLSITSTCAGKPAAGTVTGPATAVCSGTNFLLTGTGITLGTGMHYQWQSRPASTGAFVNMTATDTFTTLTTNTTTNKDYRLVSQCLLSGQSDTTTLYTARVLAPATISATTDTTFCIGGSVILSSSPLATGATYTWFKDGVTTGLTGSSYTASTTGVYTLMATTTDCPTGALSNSKTVTVNPLPTAAFSALSATTFCDGLSVGLQATTGAGYTYQWQRGGVDISGATSSLYTATVGGVYRVKVTNSTTGCTNTSTTTTVTVNPTPTAPVISGAGGKTSFCTSDNLVLSTTAISGLSYQWRDLSGIIAGATSASYTATSANTYRLTATLGSCSATSTGLVITENPLPTAVIVPVGAISFCNGDSLKVSATTSAGVSYQWLESGTPIAGAPAASSIFVKTAGVYSVKVTNTTTGCNDQSSTLTVTIITPTKPTVAASGPTEFCIGGSVTLTATVASGLTTQWQESGTDIPAEILTTLTTSTAGSYRMKVTNGVGCAGYSDPVDVIVNSLPDNTISVTGGTNICNGTASSILAPIVPGYTYQWRNLGVNIPGEVYNPYSAKTAGTFSVEITDSNGCKATSTDVVMTIMYVSPFYIHPYGNTFFCDGEKTKLATQAGFTTYQWYLNGVFIPGATDSFTFADKNGKYSVKVQDPVNGCFATSTGFSILVIPSPDTPFITKVGSRLSTTVKGVTYQWYKDGVAIAGATDSFTMTTGTGGIYAVVVTNSNDCSKRSEIDLSVTGINEAVSSTYYIKVYPNPTQDKLNIDAPKEVTVTLIDLQGRKLFTQKEAKQIDMSQLASGVYILQFTDANNQVVATEKVSKVDY